MKWTHSKQSSQVKQLLPEAVVWEPVAHGPHSATHSVALLLSHLSACYSSKKTTYVGQCVQINSIVSAFVDAEHLRWRVLIVLSSFFSVIFYKETVLYLHCARRTWWRACDTYRCVHESQGKYRDQSKRSRHCKVWIWKLNFKILVIQTRSLDQTLCCWATLVPTS